MEVNKPKVIKYDGVQGSGCTTKAIENARELYKRGFKVLVIFNNTSAQFRFKRDSSTACIASKCKYEYGKSYLNETEFDYIILDKCDMIIDSNIYEIIKYNFKESDVILRLIDDVNILQNYIERLQIQSEKKQTRCIISCIENEINTIVYSEEKSDNYLDKIDKLVYARKFIYDKYIK